MRVQYDALLVGLFIGIPPKPCKSLSLLMPMSLTHLSNIVKGNDFMNNYA
jgi:hypothetical protein